MFTKLRRHIILIEMGAFLFITVLIIGTINVGYTAQINRNAHILLTLLEKYGGTIPEIDVEYKDISEVQSSGDEPYIRLFGETATFDENQMPFIDLGFGLKLTDETRYTTRHFWVKVDSDDNIIDADLSSVAAESIYEVQKYIAAATNNPSNESHCGRYYYLKVPDDDGNTEIYFVDCYAMIESRNSLTRTSIFIAVISMAFAALFVWILSKKAIAPLKSNIEMQKRFITDASHELKTPLAAIQVNADVLELTMGENPTIDKIKRQVNNMSGLVEEMLTLSRMDSSGEQKEEFAPIDFSALVEEKASDFLPRAEGQGKTLSLNVSPGITINGIQKGVERLVSVLCDNAVKYCSDGGEITVSLTSAGLYAKLEISNTSERLSDEDIKHLFDRFYRTDSSRSKETGGYGIGLSIAKTVVDQHKGKINAANKGDTVCFTVELPLKKPTRK